MAGLGQKTHCRVVAGCTQWIKSRIAAIQNSSFGDRRLTGPASNSHIRPQAVGRGYISISTGRTPGERIEWPLFGEQIDDLTATNRLRPNPETLLFRPSEVLTARPLLPKGLQGFNKVRSNDTHDFIGPNQ